MDFSTINYWAVLVAALSAFLIGGIWFSPILLGKAWLDSNGFTEEQVKGFSPARKFGWSFVFTLVMSINLAMFLNDPATDAVWGATAGFLAGFGWIFMGVGTIAVFENRSWKYIWVNGGYMIVALTVMGLILGGWR